MRRSLRSPLLTNFENKETSVSQSKRLASQRKRLASYTNRLGSHTKHLASKKGRLAPQRNRLAPQRNRLASYTNRLASQRKRIGSHTKHLAFRKRRSAPQRKRLASYTNRLASQRKFLGSLTKHLASQRKRLESNTKRLASHRKLLASQKLPLASHKKRFAFQRKRSACPLMVHQSPLSADEHKVPLVMLRLALITGLVATYSLVNAVVRDECRECTLSVACWLAGGSGYGTCPSSNSFTSWLYTCCHYSSQRLPPIPPQLPVATHNRLFRRRDSLNRQDRVECGVPALTLQKRIIGGSEAYFGELPWQAHLRIGGYQCGGALVSRKHVITAAHCVHRAHLHDILVYLGEYDTQNTGYEPYPEEVHRVIQKYVHPNFQFRLAQPDRFDVALIRLARGVIFKENILPICLPKKSTNLMGKTGLVAGWGKTDTTYGKTGTNILRKAIVPILTDAECLKWHRHKNIRVELHKEMFCAGHSDGRMDACLGDSGGPLIVIDKGHWTLAGITSAGFGCAVDHQPGIYHKVQFTADWINSVISST